MSDTKEILEVFNDEINHKSRQVFNKMGILPFLDGMTNIQIKDLYRGLLDEDDLALLTRIVQQEGGLGEEK